MASGPAGGSSRADEGRRTHVRCLSAAPSVRTTLSPVRRTVRPDIRITRPVREYRDLLVVPYEPDGQVLSYKGVRLSGNGVSAREPCRAVGPHRAAAALRCFGVRGVNGLGATPIARPVARRRYGRP